MVKKSLGFVELEWTCPQCENRNPGPQKTCSSCGAPQPDDIEFQQAAEEKLIVDPEKIKRAKAGPDVHCAFCGTRNPSTAKSCTQCGAELGSAEARATGRVLGAHRAKPAPKVECPQCGASNPASALKCSQCGGNLSKPAPSAPKRPALASAAQPRRKIGLPGILGLGVLVLVLIAACVVVFMSLAPSEEINGQVQSVRWERSIVVEQLQDVTKQAWWDEVPANAPRGTCSARVRKTVDEAVPDSVEVCGTPYTVDTGTGYGEVAQDCVYEVYEDWCEYTEQEWKAFDTLILSGEDLSPMWPASGLSTSQREGERKETYRVVFSTEEKTYTYAPSNADRFQQFEIGSRWVLETNALGGVRSVQSAD